MTRAVFQKGELDLFITACKTKTDLSLPQLAKVLKIERHTLNDWRRETLLPNHEKVLELSKFAKLSPPQVLLTKPDSWGSTRAAKIKYKLYGCTLTHADRVKAGHNSQLRRKENPEYYRSLGCNISKQYVFPDKNNPLLSEFIGIMLGDGHIGYNGQISITLNSIADKNYIEYVIKLINNLFGYKPSLFKHKMANAVNIYLSGVNLINFLVEMGLKIGDKVKQQVGVPTWIKENSEYSRWCLRDLMDTDGGIFTNPYTINHKSYVYPKTNFTNASQPLLDFVYKTLINNDFHPNNKMPRKIWLYSQKESIRYLQVIGSSNERLLNKIQCYNH